ncbi:acyl-coa desaturase [Holotrichia oblita]|uniref:Acyl-coa desaturase n=1 Tax=Holotrichia oblita TaxID=644536 RepID=A0ACB9SZB2_HOLOL|nr:acyl-coa desaturase [Holotrichia oblita]
MVDGTSSDTQHDINATCETTTTRFKPTGVLLETDEETNTKLTQEEETEGPREYQLVWRNIILYIYLHISFFYAFYLIFTSAKLLTTLHAFLLIIIGNLGITCGAHRLWSHRSYKAKTPLKIILVIMQTVAFQRDRCRPPQCEAWFFFAHVGWLLTKKHPDVRTKGKVIDISDLTNDPILSFQHKHYVRLMLFTAFLVPTAIPMIFWKETFFNAWLLNLFRYCIGLNTTWLVNSAAHMFGSKPYDRFINPSENFSVAALALGEGWHNYHHTFPWDYKTSELGKYTTNISTAFIDFFAKLGWAYDLKTVSEDMVRKRTLRTGDGTHSVWGWKDNEMCEDDIRNTVVSKNQ